MANTGSRALPAGVTESLSAAEQAHIDSGGETALEAAPEPASAPAPELAPEAAAPAAPAPTGAEPEPAAEKPKMVPHAALHEEREARKAAEKRAQLLEQRTNLLLQQLGPRPADPAQPATAATVELLPVPDIEKDAPGHLLARLQNNETIQRILMPVLGQLVQGAMANQQQGQAAELTRRAVASEQAFTAETPDYPEASRFVMEQRHRQLAAIGHSDPAERQRIIGNEAHHLAARALQSGGNPAAAIYQLAKAMGFQKSGSAQATAPGAATPATRLANAAAGQRQAGALGSLRGSGPTPLTAQRLLELSDSEFARAIATPEGRALLGA
jgi:hypothetical protein